MKINNTDNVSFKQHQLLCSNDSGVIDGMQFDRKMNVSDALTCVKNEPKLQSGVAGDKTLLSEFLKNISKMQDLPLVSKLLNSGSTAIVFETENGDVLKLTKGNHFTSNRPHASFDVPIFKTWRQGSTHVYLEEKLSQDALSPEFVDVVLNDIRKAGYKPKDIGCSDVQQIGMSKEGELYLLDSECAKYKNIFKAIFDKFTRLFRKGK